jgi:hypothetical protein
MSSMNDDYKRNRDRGEIRVQEMNTGHPEKLTVPSAWYLRTQMSLRTLFSGTRQQHEATNPPPTHNIYRRIYDAYTISYSSRGSSVSIVTVLRAGLPGFDSRIKQGLFLVTASRAALPPPPRLSDGSRGYFPGGKATEA